MQKNTYTRTITANNHENGPHKTISKNPCHLFTGLNPAINPTMDHMPTKMPNIIIANNIMFYPYNFSIPHCKLPFRVERIFSRIETKSFFLDLLTNIFGSLVFPGLTRTSNSSLYSAA